MKVYYGNKELRLVGKAWEVRAKFRRMRKEAGGDALLAEWLRASAAAAAAEPAPVPSAAAEEAVPAAAPAALRPSEPLAAAASSDRPAPRAVPVVLDYTSYPMS